MNLLWLDLETTGSEPGHDPIMEVGAFITDKNLAILSEDFHYIIQLNERGFARLMDNEYVRRMHQGNGLLIEAMNASKDIGQADKDLHLFIRNYLDYSEDTVGKIMLAGSGVAAFDRPMIRVNLPLLEEHLDYASLDVGHIRRFLFKICKVMQISDTKTHRALDDIHYHHSEAIDYKKLITDALP